MGLDQAAIDVTLLNEIRRWKEGVGVIKGLEGRGGFMGEV